MLRRLLALTLLASTGACATILGFEEPTDLLTGSDAKANVADVVKLGSDTDPGSPPDSSPSASASASSSGTHETPTEDADVPLVAVECSCVPSAAAGWNGPFVVAEGIGREPPTCRGDYAEPAFYGRNGPTAAPAECSCACGAPADVACSVPAASLFTTNTCGGEPCAATTTALGCADAIACDSGTKRVVGASFGPSLPSGGQCQPSANVVIPAASWTKSIRLCAPAKTASTCDGGLCQVPPSPLFATRNRCVAKAGDHTCPVEFPVKQTFYADPLDTRSCSACACGAPVGATCTASVKVLSSGSCRVDTTSPATADCVGFVAGSRLEVTAGVAAGGSCAPSGGIPTGDLVPGEATTVCCLE